jgi:hypothetical protein
MISLIKTTVAMIKKQRLAKARRELEQREFDKLIKKIEDEK